MSARRSPSRCTVRRTGQRAAQSRGRHRPRGVARCRTATAPTSTTSPASRCRRPDDNTDNVLDPSKASAPRRRSSPSCISARPASAPRWSRTRSPPITPSTRTKRYIIAGRIAAGSIFGAGLFDVPPRRRFYVGGGGTLRGYDYSRRAAQRPRRHHRRPVLCRRLGGSAHQGDRHHRRRALRRCRRRLGRHSAGVRRSRRR